MPLFSTSQNLLASHPKFSPTGTRTTVLKRPTFHRLKINISTFLTSLSHWTGRVWPMRSKRIFTIQELRDRGFRVLDWDGCSPHVLLDKKERIFVVLAGNPNSVEADTLLPVADYTVYEPTTPRRWAHVIRACERTMSGVLMDGKRYGVFTKDTESHRRGDFHAVACGVSFGGGQQKPMNLLQKPKYKEVLVRKLLNDPNLQTVAKFQSDSLKRYAPRIHAYQAQSLTALYHHDDDLRPNFSNSIYPAATFNLGPASVTAMHIDTANAECLLCAITSFGTYNPMHGGHLVLFDIGLAIVFPPGSTILIPSALLRHGNTQIQDGETRLSFTQYCAGGLLRWIQHGFRSQKSFRLQYGKGWLEKFRKADGCPEQRRRNGLQRFSKYFEDLSNYGPFQKLGTRTESTKIKPGSEITSSDRNTQKLRNAKSPKLHNATFDHRSLSWTPIDTLSSTSLHPMSRPPKRLKSMRSVSSLLSAASTTGIARTSYRMDATTGKTASSTSILKVPAHVQSDATSYQPPPDDSMSEFTPPDTLDEQTGDEPRVSRNRASAKERWRLHDRDMFLQEFLRWEGCTSGIAGLLRCLDCENGSELLDSQTMLSLHSRNPLHRIERWTGKFFTRISLASLGLTVQLGHPFGEKCGHPILCRPDFIIIHTNGIHSPSVSYCACENAIPYSLQLLRYGWYPSTSERPATVATMAVLRHFQMLSFESKASAFEFYNTLVRLTNNIGTNAVPDRFPAFMSMVRQYRHLKMLKRSGRGHDPAGILNTKPGECAVRCPACPQPGLNLPEDCYLYRLFLAVDANFRLKRKHRSSEKADPSLSTGWSYFVPEQEFHSRQYSPSGTDVMLLCGPKADNRSTCSNHKAVDSERSTKGLATTGVVGVDCARHDMKRPLGVGNLCQSERYGYTDFVFFRSLEQTSDIIEVVASYDIVCQWSVHIWERLSKYPWSLHKDCTKSMSFVFLIPKFHLPAHIMACQTPFSFNFNRFVGRTDGEGIERGWSHINPIASSTREMGPGNRRDTIDDHFGDWNWKKTYGMCKWFYCFSTSLLRKMKEAVPEASAHRQNLREFETKLDPQLLKQWKIELSAWELDHSKPNPYTKRFSDISETGVRKVLADNDALDLRKGLIYALHDTVSGSQLITMGLDLEEKQRQLAVEAVTLKNNATDIQQTRYQTQSTILQRKITAWIDIQHLYIPGLSLVRARDAAKSSAEETPFEIPLYLPSSCPATAQCDPRLQTMEWDLRVAQAGDSLAQLRDALRLRSYLYMDKDRFQVGQRQNTRARSLIERVDAKKDAAAKKYRTARSALQRLSGPLAKVGLDTTFPDLRDGDIKSLRDRDGFHVGGRPSEGRHEMSWIWKRLGSLEQEDDLLQDDLRIEWCKSQARADRWQEEVQLLREEMRRVPKFFRSRSRSWQKLATVGTHFGGRYEDEGTQAGRRAYALHQSEMYEAMAAHCESCWSLVDSYIAHDGNMGVVPKDVDISPEKSEESLEGSDEEDEEDDT
ncbi:hypothetical protein H0H93_012949 [Arthromyces matolae]|nr:hypothetical protein H0H93_012949 [Arthromyces matolae]